jgi:hypothetical protein
MEVKSTPDGDVAQHWDAVYSTRATTEVSWFQADPTVSIELIELLKVPHDAAVIDIGGGASFLIDSLVHRGFSDVSVLDVSKAALEVMNRRLGGDARVTLWHENLLHWHPTRRFHLWHDRAVFHFLVSPADRNAYLEKLKSALEPGGAAVIGTFDSNGPESCSGLPVTRHSAEELAFWLGDGFEIVETRSEEHFTPAGIMQPFTWISARRRE